MTERTVQRVSRTQHQSDKLEGEETMKTETYIPHPLVTLERHPRSNAQIAAAANSRNDSNLPRLSADSDRDSLLVWLERLRAMCAEGVLTVADLDDLTLGEAWDRLDAILAKTEPEPETCSDCGGTALRLDTSTGAVDCGNETMTRQERAEAGAYEDGVRCRRKGLGITASGLYDFTTWRRLFGRVCVPCPDREAAYDAWTDGWYDEDDRLSSLAQGLLPCGRPIGGAA